MLTPFYLLYYSLDSGLKLETKVQFFVNFTTKAQSKCFFVKRNQTELMESGGTQWKKIFFFKNVDIL